MPTLNFLNHLLSFIAPALFLALVLAVVARLVWPAKAHVVPWYHMACINALLGVLLLALGLVLTGQDGRISTYAVLAIVMASCQWLMSGGWHK